MGGGYTIKQVGTDLYCAVANGTQFEGQSVVLSSVPTVWTLAYLDSTAQTVMYAFSPDTNILRLMSFSIYWSTSMSNMVWQEFTVNQRRSVRIFHASTRFKFLTLLSGSALENRDQRYSDAFYSMAFEASRSGHSTLCSCHAGCLLFAE